MDFIIKKLGWENAAELDKSARNIWEDYKKWRTQAVVVSAIRSSEFNTTDKLIELWECIWREKVDESLLKWIISKLKEFHLDILENKLLCIKTKIIDIVEEEFKFLEESLFYYISNKKSKNIPSLSNDYSIELENKKMLSILWFWEIVSCKIFSGVIDIISDEWIYSKSIDLSNLINKKELEWKESNEIFDLLSIKISDIVDEQIKWWKIPVLSWYIGSFEWWIEENIGRWYSDATAAVCTVGLSWKWYPVTLEIQKSVIGFLSADPRILKNPDDAVCISKMDYLMAREITWDTWAQAKLLHPQALRSKVQEAGVKIHLYDPFSGHDGSWIVNEIQKDEQVECSGISFVWGREDVVFFSISSWKMFEKWILAHLFTIVKKYFSVDIISASETEITFTIDWNWKCDTKLEEMTKEIREEFHMWENTFMEFVEYKKHKSLIFCVWKHMKDYIGLMAKVVNVLSKNNINIEIASQWRLQRAMIFWIKGSDMKKAVNVLHDEFIK